MTVMELKNHFQLEYTLQAEKKINKLGYTHQEIERSIAEDPVVFDASGKIQSVHEGSTGSFKWIYGETSKVLIRVEVGKNRILVMDVDRQRGLSQA